ncbi:MAG: phenylalanine--tRNA ligase subunit beta, partial [Pseudomonadota bacterium]
MKFSETWLREWVDPALAREALLEQLTMAGLEVDGVEPVGAEFSGVVVAEVSACEQHPNADKLTLCTVQDGQDTYQVICGAPNVRAGLVVAFARVGAVLPDNFKIKKAKLRGVESFGMLCSARELGLGDDHEGILELPESWAAGTDLREVMALSDVSVDLDLTPNRGDCLSLKGLAREVGVLNNLPVNFPDIPPVPASHDATFPVTLQDADGCPNYVGRVIRGIDVTRPTPLWMKERLRRCGLRSIDAVVDVTNYVLIELGQPMHAFDLGQLSGGIVVRRAAEHGTDKLTLLDGQEVVLDAQTLLITDASGPVAMAGVMGGERSGVQVDTADVFLESAFFAPLAIAGTARRYGLHTDASHRYERGVDYRLQRDAIERATQLLLEIVGGTAGPVVETTVAEEMPTEHTVTMRQRRLVELLGVTIDAADVDAAFNRLDFVVQQRVDTPEGIEWTISSPSHRFDIALEADLVEEICRIYGYNNIPVKQPLTELSLSKIDIETHPEAELKKHLAGLGLQEVITYSFVEPGLQDLLDPQALVATLANPMSSEQSVMRTNLLPGLVDVAQANRARQQDRVGIFELGSVFRPAPDGLTQPLILSGLLWGQRQQQAWHANDAVVDYFDIKGLVDNLLEWAGIQTAQFTRASDKVLHPGQSAELSVDGVTVGRLGRLHPEIEQRLGMEGLYIFELLAETALMKPRRVFSGVSRYPSVRRDFAVVLDKKIDAKQVEKLVRDTLGGILVDFRLFDVYEGKGIDSNEKSLAIGLTLQSQTATLTEEEISNFTQQALTALETG